MPYEIRSKGNKDEIFDDMRRAIHDLDARINSSTPSGQGVSNQVTTLQSENAALKSRLSSIEDRLNKIIDKVNTIPSV